MVAKVASVSGTMQPVLGNNFPCNTLLGRGVAKAMADNMNCTIHGIEEMLEHNAHRLLNLASN